MNATSNQSLSNCTKVIKYRPQHFYSTIISNKHTNVHKITHISTKSQLFCTAVKIFLKIFLHIKFILKYLIVYKTYQSLSGSKFFFSSDSHFRTVNTKISPQNISLLPPPNQHTLCYKHMATDFFNRTLESTSGCA